MRFFISSTFKDLIDFRGHVINVLENLTNLQTGSIAAMEYFAASENTCKEECLKELENSDVVIGIYGERFGTVDSETGKSMTELEFDYATEHNKTILAFVSNSCKEERQEAFINNKVFARGVSCAKYCNLEDFANRFDKTIKNYFLSVGAVSYETLWSKLKEMKSQMQLARENGSWQMVPYGENEIDKALTDILEATTYIEEQTLPQVWKMLNEQSVYPDPSLYSDITVSGEHLHIGFPNAITEIKLATSYLMFSYAQSRLLKERWTKELWDSLFLAYGNYMETVNKSISVD